MVKHPRMTQRQVRADDSGGMPRIREDRRKEVRRETCDSFHYGMREVPHPFETSDKGSWQVGAVCQTGPLLAGFVCRRDTVTIARPLSTRDGLSMAQGSLVRTAIP